MTDKYNVYPNDEEGCRRFCKDIKAMGDNVVVVFEATDSIILYLAELLVQNGIARSEQMAGRIRHYAKGAGLNAKTDKIDSKATDSESAGVGSGGTPENCSFSSGNRVGKRIAIFGRREIRCLLYMCVRAALNSKKGNDYHKRFRHFRNAKSNQANYVAKRHDLTRRLWWRAFA